MTINFTGDRGRFPSRKSENPSDRVNGGKSNLDPYSLLARRAAARHVRQLSARQRRDQVANLWTMLDGELDRLPEECRTPIVLCHLEGRSLDEAVLILAWSRGKIRRGLAHGWRRLRERLARQGVSVSSETLGRLLRRDVRSGGISASLMTTTLQAATQAVRAPGPMTAVSSRVARLARQSLKLLNGW